MKRWIWVLGCSLFLTAQSASHLTVASQSTQTGQAHLLIEIPNSAGPSVEKIVLKFPDTVVVAGVQPGLLPKGWSLKEGTHKVTLKGPATPLPFLARLDFGKQKLANQLDIKVSSGGAVLYERKDLFLKILPELQVTQSLRGLLALPPLLTPGETVDIRLPNLEKTPITGTWSLAAQTLTALPDPNLPGHFMLQFTVPANITSAPLEVTYANRFGLKTVVATPSGTRVTPPLTRTPASPRIAACSTRGILSGALCVGGWFPNAAARNGLLIDGKPAGVPLSAANQALFLPLKPDLKPGKHVLSGDPAAGFAPTDQFTFEAVHVQAEMDKTELVANQESQLTFMVAGTEAPLQVRVFNTTPEVIELQGGNEQIIRTGGGAGNLAMRSVVTKALGNFIIEYELAEERCPCLKNLDPSGLLVIP